MASTYHVFYLLIHRRLARAQASAQRWRVLGWLPPRQLQAMCHIAQWDLVEGMPRQGQQQQQQQQDHTAQQRERQQKRQQQERQEQEGEQQQRQRERLLDGRPPSQWQQEQWQQERGFFRRRAEFVQQQEWEKEDQIWASLHAAALESAQQQVRLRLQHVPRSSRYWYDCARVSLPKQMGGCPGVWISDEVKKRVPAYPFNRRLGVSGAAAGVC